MDKYFNILCCFVCIIAIEAQADFTSAVKTYNEKKFPDALKEFERAAELGHKQSQLNIGVMYFRGEGMPKNIVEAYGWTVLSAEDGNTESIRIRDIIFAKLDEQQKIQAEKSAKNLIALYGTEKLRAILYPIHSEKKSNLVYGSLKAMSPIASSTMAEKIAKYELEYDIDPQGYIHNFSFLEKEGVNDPEKLINYLASLKHSPQRLAGKSIWAYGAEYKFIRTGMGRRNQLIDAINDDIREGFTPELDWSNAENVYKHAIALSYPEKSDKKQQYKKLLLLQAAQMGHPKALIAISLQTLYGEKFEQDRSKGLLWLLAAAESKDNSALYLAASVLYEGELVDADKAKAIQFLQQAADQQHIKSKMKLAWILATDKNNDLYNPQKSLLLVKEIYADYLDHVTAYETYAAALAANEQFNEAISIQESAVAFAKNIDANLDQLQARLNTYKQHKAWRE